MPIRSGSAIDKRSKRLRVILAVPYAVGSTATDSVTEQDNSVDFSKLVTAYESC